MKKGFLFLAVLLIMITTVSGQDSWKYYSNDNWIKDLKVIDDELWIATPSSLYIHNLDTKKSRYLQSWNSDLRGGNVEEILATDEFVYISLQQGGIARYKRDGIPFGQGEWDQYYAPVEGDLDTINQASSLFLDDEDRLWFYHLDYNDRDFCTLKDGVVEIHEQLTDAISPTEHNTNDLYFFRGVNDLDLNPPLDGVWYWAFFLDRFSKINNPSIKINK